MKSNELFRASGVMAIGTILSRITGFFRAILAVAEADAMVKGQGRDPEFAVERMVDRIASRS